VAPEPDTGRGISPVADWLAIDGRAIGGHRRCPGRKRRKPWRVPRLPTGPKPRGAVGRTWQATELASSADRRDAGPTARRYFAASNFVKLEYFATISSLNDGDV
jgi:hypothetical protein